MKLVIADATLGEFNEKDLDSLIIQLQNSTTWINLNQIPPHSRLSARFQLLTGLNPEWTGVFDEFYVRDYQVLPTQIPLEVEQQLLWKIIEAMGKSITTVNSVSSNFSSDLIYAKLQALSEIKNLYDISDEEAVKILILPQPSTWQEPTIININDFFESKGVLERTDNGDIIWEETLAYHAGHGQIWINLSGRDPSGVVTPGKEYDEVREALARMLSKKLIDTKTDTPMIAHIYKKEEIYNHNGRFFTNAPDMVVTSLPGYIFSHKGVHITNREYLEQHLKLQVEHYLMFIWGNNIKSKHVGAGNLVDLVPTVLYILNLSIPTKLNGKIIWDIFEPAFLKNTQPHYQTENSLTPQEEAMLVDRLEALGYIE